MEFKVLSKNDPFYPKSLKNIDRSPQKLYLHGNLIERDYDGIAVVGSRAMTSYGEASVKSIVGDLISAGITVVSGLAFGIDACAQKLALEMGGRTVAILGSGLHKISPVSHFYIAKQIVDSNQGAVISSYEVNFEAKNWTFPERDWLIAAFSKAVLVVEAGEKSGTSYTVEAALELGKEVFVVPGSIFNPMSVGCHRYIRDGARIVTCAQDIFDSINFFSGSTQISDSFVLNKSLRSKIVTKVEFANRLEEKVYSSLSPSEQISVEDLCEKMQEPIAKILPILTFFELKSVIQIRNGKILRR